MQTLDHEFRRAGLGGSDMPIVMGLSGYKTPYQLFLEKTGVIKPSAEMTDVQYWGQLLEPVIRDEYIKRNGVNVIARNNVVHPDYDFMRGNVDGFIEETNSVLEIKTSSAWMADKWGEKGSDIIPMSYLIQVAHYCVVLGAKDAKIAVLIGGNDYREYTYKRHAVLEQKIIDAAIAFWGSVTNDVAPPASTIDDLSKMYKSRPDVQMIANDDTLRSFKQYRRYDKAIKRLEEVKNQYKFEIIEFMQGADCLVDTEGVPLLTHREAKNGSRRFLLKKEGK